MACTIYNVNHAWRQRGCKNLRIQASASLQEIGEGRATLPVPAVLHKTGEIKIM